MLQPKYHSKQSNHHSGFVGDPSAFHSFSIRVPSTFHPRSIGVPFAFHRLMTSGFQHSPQPDSPFFERVRQVGRRISGIRYQVSGVGIRCQILVSGIHCPVYQVMERKRSADAKKYNCSLPKSGPMSYHLNMGIDRSDQWDHMGTQHRAKNAGVQCANLMGRQAHN